MRPPANPIEIILYIFFTVAVTITAATIDNGFSSRHWLIAAIGICMLFALCVLALAYYYLYLRASHYLWFVFYKMWIMVIGTVGLCMSSFALYNYFGELTTTSGGSPFLTSRGGDFLLFFFGAAASGALVVYGMKALSPLSFQQPLKSEWVRMQLSYSGSIASQKVPDKGNHRFAIEFTLKPLLDHYSVRLIALERLEDNKRTNVAWTSRKMRPVRPLGVSAEKNGTPRIDVGSRRYPCIVRDGTVLWAFAFAKSTESWFDPGTTVRATVYFMEGGCLQDEVTIPKSSSAMQVTTT
jgi:hypothetical protein